MEYLKTTKIWGETDLNKFLPEEILTDLDRLDNLVGRDVPPNGDILTKKDLNGKPKDRKEFFRKSTSEENRLKR